MARHFITLYLSIVATLAAVSWGQDQLSHAYDEQSARAATEDASERAVLALAQARLLDVATPDRSHVVAELARRTGVDLELFELHDIAGEETLTRLAQGRHALMNTANGQTWMLQQLSDSDQVLAFKYTPTSSRRSALEWLLVFVFYAAIALVLMLWLWPLSRDLRHLERSTMTFGNRAWRFDTQIGTRSQIYPLAEAFRRMASRIDGLISSHQDMSNAMSHEIKTPLARMRFEIEMARTARTPQQFGEHLDNLNADIAELNSFVTATLDYAILERAEVALNMANHDFTHLLPAIVESVRRNAPSDIVIACTVASDATHVRCDAHLMESVVRNLLLNALRHARTRVRLSFRIDANACELSVADDGPGIAEADRERVFESFVQLGERTGPKAGFGLGLAIVKRVMEWHRGHASVSTADLGGASFEVRWPNGATDL